MCKLTDAERREKARARSKAYYEANKEAVLAKQKANREANKEAKKAYYEDRGRLGHIKRSYGLEYDPITEDSTCEVCGSSDRLRLDHDHSTGKFRGILCSHCNTALGLLGEDSNRMRALIRYNDKHKHNEETP